MRTVILLVPLVLLAGCRFGESDLGDSPIAFRADDQECVGAWPAAAPALTPKHARSHHEGACIRHQGYRGGSAQFRLLRLARPSSQQSL